MDTTAIAETAAAAANIDTSLIISIIALVASALSPLATAWLQGKYRLKEKKLEAQKDIQRYEQQYYTEHRTEVIENYIHAGMKAAAIGTREAVSAFGVASGEIYFYLGKEYWGFLDYIDQCAEKGQYLHIRSPMQDLCKKLIENGDMPRKPISRIQKGPGKQARQESPSADK